MRDFKLFENWDEENSDTSLTTEQSAMLIKSLIDVAEKGEHQKLELARNPAELRALKTLAAAQIKLVNGFTQAAHVALDSYVSELKKGIDNLQLLFNYKTFSKCADFYQEEYEMITDRILEYSTYIWSGHLIDTYLLFKDRPDSEMFDYRTGERQE